MPRHSFIQMSKLPDLKGRISYIASPDRQENLFAVYDTADTEFWTCLARESRQEFGRFGTEGKCIEARELIIALPENFTQYDPDEVLKYNKTSVSATFAVTPDAEKIRFGFLRVSLICRCDKVVPEKFFRRRILRDTPAIRSSISVLHIDEIRNADIALHLQSA